MKPRDIVCALVLTLGACEPSPESSSQVVKCRKDLPTSPGIVGCWELDAVVGSEEGLLVVEPNGEDSAARLYFFLGASLYYAEFDVMVEHIEGSAGDTTGTDTGGIEDEGQVNLRFECRPIESGSDSVACAELDFALQCNYAPTTMNCALTSGNWEQYPFAWVRCSANTCP